MDVVSYDSIGAAGAALAPRGDPADAFAAPAWFALVADTCLDPGDRVRVDAVADPAAGAAAFVLRERPDRFGPWRGRRLAGLSNFYTCRYAPSGLAEAADGAGLVAAWARHVRAGAGRPARVWFEALDRPSPVFAALAAGLRGAGYAVEAYPQFGNWYLTLEDRDVAAWWAGRPARLRNTVERKARALARHGGEVEALAGPAAADRAVADYAQVHAASWQPAEPYPGFVPDLIRRGLADGSVRVGVARLRGRPVAAQIWLTGGGRATIFKLCYDEAHKALSAGSVLTREMIAAAFGDPAVREIDFGIGDDPYKRDWLPRRRQRWGLVAYDLRTLCGLGLGARNLLPRMLDPVRRGWRREAGPADAAAMRSGIGAAGCGTIATVACHFV
jgi:hypothetical protein